MTTDDTRRHRPLQGRVDFTFMYAAHDAFRRDLRRLTDAVEAGQSAEPALRAGWATLKNQLHVHHTAFRKAAGKSQGLRGGAELFPWMLDGAPAGTSKRVLGMLPPPARLLYRAVWRPGYGRTLRRNTAVTRPAQKG